MASYPHGLWVGLTLTATIFQVFRSLEQKNLNKHVDSYTATAARFFLPLPLAFIGLVIALPNFTNSVWLWSMLATICQFFGNVFFLKCLESHNFDNSIFLRKTELPAALVLGMLVFHQSFDHLGIIAVHFITFGLLVISRPTLFGKKIKPTTTAKIKSNRTTALIYGLLSGIVFSLSGFAIQFAILDLGTTSHNDFLIASLLILSVVIFLQNILFFLLKTFQGYRQMYLVSGDNQSAWYYQIYYPLYRDLKKIFNTENRKTFLLLSLLNIVGSICWFMAYATGPVVYVKALAQSELLLSMLISHQFLKERHSLTEYIGMALTTIGILIICFNS